MREKILQTLQELSRYALGKGYEIALYYHEEDSSLMRFANSAISLNTNEHLIRLDITAYSGRQRASYSMMTDLEKIAEMKHAIDTAAAMLEHIQPLNYQPSIPTFTEDFCDETGFDPALAEMDSAAKLDYFNQAVANLETSQIKLSGIFSHGTNIIAQATTRSDHTQFFKTSDAQVSIVLAHGQLKWEITAEQSAQAKADLDPSLPHRDLTLLLKHYSEDAPVQLPLGRYDLVLGPAAVADLLSFMNSIAWNGGMMKRGFSFLSEKQVGQKVFSNQFNLYDDPDLRATFPFKRDLMGIPRSRKPIVENGIFRGFLWYQDDADEFGQRPTGSTVPHKSLILKGGSLEMYGIKGLLEQTRQRDLLYIPFLHYMNIVNPSKGIVTGSSRFGALLLKKDGSVAVPYNIRLTHSLLDIFGDRMDWVSSSTVAYNTSQSYGARNPTAILAPSFLKVNDLEISHSNSSY